MARKLRTQTRLAIAAFSALAIVALQAGTTLAGRGWP
jgi:hypothetical protein